MHWGNCLWNDTAVIFGLPFFYPQWVATPMHLPSHSSVESSVPLGMGLFLTGTNTGKRREEIIQVCPLNCGHLPSRLDCPAKSLVLWVLPNWIHSLHCRGTRSSCWPPFLYPVPGHYSLTVPGLLHLCFHSRAACAVCHIYPASSEPLLPLWRQRCLLGYCVREIGKEDLEGVGKGREAYG